MSTDRSAAAPRLLAPVVPSWLIAGGSLVAGFVVAEATDVRALGGLVLLVGIVWCWLLWNRRRGVLVAAGLTAVYATAFGLSHLVADAIGAIPSVLLFASIVAVLAFALADRQTGRIGD